jgi:hypothetical protein
MVPFMSTLEAGDWAAWPIPSLEGCRKQIGEWEEALSLSEDGDTIAIGSGNKLHCACCISATMIQHGAKLVNLWAV